ncbi:class I glutamine amidotransferase-like protein [Nitzschia inconspicua]|uniref:Class I glutamine amidotransferase-like protein n=1 Tax=Nitzschia inconspicua TaxID=303405 RepID=A0A9K3LIJ4_9STRA|nr:class I glutamine amidotransferase-like protein [Nitzschia inconspicua]
MEVNTAAGTDIVPASTLQRTVGGKDDEVGQELRLLFLGCESQPPYGPYKHTASLFLDLIVLALEKIGATTHQVILDVYHVSSGQFPPRTAYTEYDGIILPGSFNSAYDTDPWILTLSKILQEEVVSKEIPTLGVCFGHQLYAHSIEGGCATKCPAGPQAGRKVSKLSPEGQKWLPTSEDLHLFYTHGDMVASLPPQGRLLGGNDDVPIQAAIYFSKKDEKKPIAITFQAHPEYASSRAMGLDRTLNQIMQAMNEREDISNDELEHAKSDAIEEFENVQKHSIESMVAVGRLLGWFPMDD